MNVMVWFNNNNSSTHHNSYHIVYNACMADHHGHLYIYLEIHAAYMNYVISCARVCVAQHFPYLWKISVKPLKISILIIIKNKDNG